MIYLISKSSAPPLAGDHSELKFSLIFCAVCVATLAWIIYHIGMIWLIYQLFDEEEPEVEVVVLPP